METDIVTITRLDCNYLLCGHIILVATSKQAMCIYGYMIKYVLSQGAIS